MRTTHLIGGILAGLFGCVQSAFAAVPAPVALPLEDGSLLLVAAVALVAAIKIAKRK